MKWLNIELSTLRSAEYVGSSPAERGTWLSVSSFCADQENGGRVSGGLKWKDRQWQQACGVTLREVRSASRLILTEGEDVVVYAYPVDREAEVRAKRDAGRRGGLATTDAKVDAARSNLAQANAKLSLGSASPEHAKLLPNGREEEGNRKGIGTKTLGKPAAVAAPTLSDEDWLKSLSADPAFTGLDVPREHAKMCAWCNANGRQPTRRRFVNWLNRCDKPTQGLLGSGAAGQFSGAF